MFHKTYTFMLAPVNMWCYSTRKKKYLIQRQLQIVQSHDWGKKKQPKKTKKKKCQCLLLQLRKNFLILTGVYVCLNYNRSAHPRDSFYISWAISANMATLKSKIFTSWGQESLPRIDSRKLKMWNVYCIVSYNWKKWEWILLTGRIPKLQCK